MAERGSERTTGLTTAGYAAGNRVAGQHKLVPELGGVGGVGEMRGVGGVRVTSVTPEYMSPQQFLRLKTSQIDVDGLAAVLDECLSDYPPFTATSDELPCKIDPQAARPSPGLNGALIRALLRGLTDDDREPQRTTSERVYEMQAGLGPSASGEPAFAGALAGAVPVHAEEPARPSETPLPQIPPSVSIWGGRQHSNAPLLGWWLLAVALLTGAVITALPARRAAGVRTLATSFDPASASPGSDALPVDSLGPATTPASPNAGVVKGAMDDAALAMVELIRREGGREIARGAVLDASPRAVLEARRQDAGVDADLSAVRVAPDAVALGLERRPRDVGGRTAAVVVLLGNQDPESMVRVRPDELINDVIIRSLVEQFVYDWTRVSIQRVSMGGAPAHPRGV